MQDFSVGILSWHSTDVLINTLKSYYDNGLNDLTNDITIYFQEINSNDIEIAQHFGAKYMGTKENIGIGAAFLKLASSAKYDNILLLEHDWELIEKSNIVKQRLDSGLFLLDSGYDCVRYRHREHPGYPHFSMQKYIGHELEYFDPLMDLLYPHLLDSVHWLQEPDKNFPGKIGKQTINEDVYYVSSSRYGNWTNNPCLYKKSFYLSTVRKFAGGGIDLEGKISHWWARQNFNVAHGEGLFMHHDMSKFGNRIKN